MPQATEPTADGSATAGGDYARRLTERELAPWKRWLDVQRPYRWNLRHLNLGRTLEVGCGIGRNLLHLDGNAVGVDHNAEAIAVARQRGLTAFTTAEFEGTDYARPRAFDSLLFAHIAEHVSHEVFVGILQDHVAYLRPAGRVVFICPQERGWATDPTHVRFVDFAELRRASDESGLAVEKQYSFPFPRPVGKVFPYNEFVVVSRRR